MKILAFAILSTALIINGTTIEKKINEFDNLTETLKDLISQTQLLEKNNTQLNSKIGKLSIYENKSLDLEIKMLNSNVSLLKESLNKLKAKNGLQFYLALCVSGFSGGFLLIYGYCKFLRRE